MAASSRGTRRASRRGRSRGNLASRSPAPRRRLVWPILASVLFVGVLFVAVFPTQTLLGQRSEVDEKQAELDVIEERNAELQQRIDELEDASYVELLAREEFGLVRPGEESYVIVPPVENDEGDEPAPPPEATTPGQ